MRKAMKDNEPNGNVGKTLANKSKSPHLIEGFNTWCPDGKPMFIFFKVV